MRLFQPTSLLSLVLLSGVLGLAALASAADTSTLPPEHHPWGRFPIGSWKTVKVNSDTLDSHGKVISSTVTETKTTLVSADANAYTLRVEVVVDVAGKRFASQPQTVKAGYCGEASGQTIRCRRLGGARFAIEGRQIDCDLREQTIEGAGTKRVTTMFYNESLPPHVFQRKTVTTNLVDGSTSSTTMQIVALNVPQKFLGDEHLASQVKTIIEHPQGVSTTVENQSLDIPGAVVAHSATETDRQGRLVRRSELSLVDYGMGTLAADDAWKGRRRIWHRSSRRGEKPEAN